MILVEKITIEEFRGIRKLTLDFKGKNFAVCGPNGTGKSGVVDALEFALTGNVSRLSGSGTGLVSLKCHAPHVDSRNSPEKARVILRLRIMSLNNTIVTIERNVRDSSFPKISPNTPEIIQALKRLEDHPEFVLSRRELIAYILATPGQRSEEIQALLRLERVGELRKTLKTISNSCDRDHDSQKRGLELAENHLLQALEITDLTQPTLLHAVNTRRSLLGLGAIKLLSKSTRLDDGLMTSNPVASSKVNKSQSLAELRNLREIIAKLSDAEINNTFCRLCSELKIISSDPIITAGATREQFLRAAITIIDKPSCPLCDTKWDIDDLCKLVRGKISKFEAIAKKRSDIEKKLEPIVDLINKLNTTLAIVTDLAKQICPDKITILFNYHVNSTSRIKIINDITSFIENIDSMGMLNDFTTEITDTITDIETVVSKIPEPTQQESAKAYLIRCQDRLDAYREAARNTKLAEDHAALAKKVLYIYELESDKVLASIYKQVEQEFSNFYRFINKDDEGNFTAQLVPSIEKLGFDVEFYGRGHFPPGAYHSEGHQDGMGLCLYLALMQKLQGGNFTFAVLDDVLMSVDVGHRREVCGLLKEHFPNTQFVLTTHDEVWLKHMVSAGLVGSSNSVRFSNWSPDQGPTEWNSREVWLEIDAALSKGNVRAAAGDLRYYLEHIFQEICQNLQVRVIFRNDNRYELGDILCSAVKKYQDILDCGGRTAKSWGNETVERDIDSRKKLISDSFKASNTGQWQINQAIHYNEWLNLTATEFKLVADAFHDLVKNFFCDNPDCNGPYYLTFAEYKKLDSLRCRCGKTNINLKKKPQ